MPTSHTMLEHTGDIGIEVRAKTMAQLFQASARILMNLMVQTARLSSQRMCTFQVDGENPEELLKNWLSEVLYEFTGKGMILTRFKIARFGENTLTATAACRRFNPRRDRLKTEIKAVTYHQLEIKAVKDGWSARIIFDV